MGVPEIDLMATHFNCQVFFPLLLPAGSGPGCSLSEVGLQAGLPISTNYSDPQIIGEDHGGGSTRYCDSSILAEEAMVSPSLSSGGVSSNKAPSGQGPSHLQRPHSPQLGLSGHDCMEFERSKLQNRNLSDSVMSTILSSRKESTKGHLL